MKEIPESVKAELAALEGRTDDDIDYSNIPDTSGRDWSHATRGHFYRPIKQQVTLRIDADIIDWLKGEDEKGYQTRLNKILRTAMMEARHPVRAAMPAREAASAPARQAASARQLVSQAPQASPSPRPNNSAPRVSAPETISGPEVISGRPLPREGARSK